MGRRPEAAACFWLHAQADRRRNSSRTFSCLPALVSLVAPRPHSGWRGACSRGMSRHGLPYCDDRMRCGACRPDLPRSPMMTSAARQAATSSPCACRRLALPCPILPHSRCTADSLSSVGTIVTASSRAMLATVRCARGRASGRCGRRAREACPEGVERLCQHHVIERGALRAKA